ncbi:MAG: GNAT family N-acetyltransferase [Planctomycetes bacterium]|nr:GNAT family N-acetyltransferase [Planctomycetota bacterium]MBL7038838.1 GNAT family N-acetyltransferase [Pirellulaceae bacterium]
MTEFRIEPFDKKKHQRSSFCCGKPPLDEFIRTLVSQYEKRRLGRTFVAVPTDDRRSVIGYYTLASSAVACANLPPDAAKRLPRHPVPVVLLARLAVDQRFQGQRLGEALLVDALQRAAELSKSLGVFAVEVLAADEQAATFYAKYGFMPLLDDPRHLFFPISAIVAGFSGSCADQGKH